jgi:hypothetical protein
VLTNSPRRPHTAWEWIAYALTLGAAITSIRWVWRARYRHRRRHTR